MAFFVVAVVAITVAGIIKGNSDNMTFVSNTEYYYGDEGEVAVEIQDYQNNPITANCYATAYNPDKTQFFYNQSMSLNNDSDVYYYKFTVPELVGVFEYRVDCYFNSRHLSRAKSFHVSNGTQAIIDEVNNQGLVAVMVK